MGSTTAVGGSLWPSMRALQIWGANTDVGKTIFSAILCLSAANKRPLEGVYYIKPVSTGLAEHMDSKHIRRAHLGIYKNKRSDGEWFDSGTIVQYDVPVSPHIAAAQAEGVSQD